MDLLLAFFGLDCDGRQGYHSDLFIFWFLRRVQGWINLRGLWSHDDLLKQFLRTNLSVIFCLRICFRIRLRLAFTLLIHLEVLNQDVLFDLVDYFNLIVHLCFPTLHVQEFSAYSEALLKLLLRVYFDRHSFCKPRNDIRCLLSRNDLFALKPSNYICNFLLLARCFH